MYLRPLIISAAMAAVFASSAAPKAPLTPISIEDSLLSQRRSADNARGIDFSVFDRQLTPEQREYLTFLYAYMPLPDIADHSSDFYLENVDVALQARREMPWGKDIPEREFRYFVVPLRINDEPLDGHRRLFYDELKDRVKDLSIEDAILEINHWCHEKATYQPSDGRTHSPLQTCYTAIGRCGEESTFTVAALRAMGIPARQVYTPRWAHTDDNHAWVEAYANGRWHFLGACEPEPVLDLGWFNAPASRGMLMNTRVLGQYRGPEEILMNLPAYTDINVTSNYAPVETVKIVVANPDGSPADSARVDFCLYNYGEFYPLTSRTFLGSDPVTFDAGRGDLMVWANDGKRYGFRKYTVGKDGVATVTLDKSVSSTPLSFEFDMVPPEGANNLPPVTPQQAEINNYRKAQEDSIRGSYTASFATPEQSRRLASELGLDPDRIVKVMTDARANHSRLSQFLRSTPADKREQALALLEVISLKDRSDVDPAILQDHMNLNWSDSPFFAEYVLNPRVDNEQLSAFRSAFSREFSADSRKAFAADPASWEKWVKENIEVIEPWYPARVRISPAGVLATRRSDNRSREIFYVAGARAMGIPARIDQITNKTQWADADGIWHDVNLSASSVAETSSSCSGTLALTYSQVGRIDDPKYYTHFTLSKIVDGRPQLMGYDDFAPWSTTFAAPQPMDCGEYMLVTGQRMADGSVLSHVTTFNITDGESIVVPLTMRQDSTGVQVIGNLDAESRYMATGETAPRSILSTTGRGYYILGILNPTHEPSVHTINDIADVASDLEASGLPIVLLANGEGSVAKLSAALASKNMPSTVATGYDIDSSIFNAAVENLKLDPSMLPVFVIADTFNRVVFVSQGYTIGLGDKLLDVIHKINN